jgi:hypothetical protein
MRKNNKRIHFLNAKNEKISWRSPEMCLYTNTLGILVDALDKTSNASLMSSIVIPKTINHHR